MPDGVEFRLGEADSNGLALPADSTRLGATTFLPVRIFIVCTQFIVLLFTK